MFKGFIHKSFVIIILQLKFFNLAFSSDYQIECQPLVIEKIASLPQKGILKQKENGYLYIDVCDEYITEALSVLEAPGKILPPGNYRNKNGIGAHISVMYETEQIIHEIWDIKELGQEYSFTIVDLRTVKIRKNNKIEKLWIIAVDAPELERLRESYGLSSKLKGHDFHITIGTQKPGKENQQKEEVKLQEAA